LTDWPTETPEFKTLQDATWKGDVIISSPLLYLGSLDGVAVYFPSISPLIDDKLRTKFWLERISWAFSRESWQKTAIGIGVTTGSGTTTRIRNDDKNFNSKRNRITNYLRTLER
jgi:hypothetical protein